MPVPMVMPTTLLPPRAAPRHHSPTVAIFGPTVPSFGFGPLAAKSAIVEDDLLACRPCDRHGPQRCPLGHWKCMLLQSPERVAGIVAGYITS